MPTLPPENGEPPTLAFRAGSLMGAGALAAALASAPSALRVASDQHGVAVVWLALTACTMLPATIAIAAGRGAREGARAFAGEEVSLAAWSVTAWAVASFLALTGLGGLLRATTHHHGLAGVTFAIVGVGAFAVIALVVRRIAAIARDIDPFARSALLGATLIGLVIVGLLVVVRIARAGAGDALTGPMADAFLDALAFGVGAIVFSRPEITRAWWLGRVGLPLVLGVVFLGLALLARDPSLVAGIRAHAPWFGALAANAAD